MQVLNTYGSCTYIVFVCNNCETESIIGAEDKINLKILHDVNIFRFPVDVRSIKKFPGSLGYGVEPFTHDIYYIYSRKNCGLGYSGSRRWGASKKQL